MHVIDLHRPRLNLDACSHATPAIAGKFGLVDSSGGFSIDAEEREREEERKRIRYQPDDDEKKIVIS